GSSGSSAGCSPSCTRSPCRASRVPPLGVMGGRRCSASPSPRPSASSVTLPPYLALLLSVAVVGSVAYGALALGAYGLGLATPILLGSAALGPAGRATRLLDWLVAKRDALHVAQGILFAALGALVLVFFWVRYAVPPP